MSERIRTYAKRLKLSWIKNHVHEVEATTNEDFLLKLFEAEIRHREERRMNLHLTQATLPKVRGKPFDWSEVQIPGGITKEALLSGIHRTARECHFLWWSGCRENIFGNINWLKCHTKVWQVRKILYRCRSGKSST